VIVAGETHEQTAKRLLVAPEALRLAQAELDEDRRREGRVPVELGAPSRNRAAGKSVEVAFPVEIFEDWQGYCAHRDLAPATVLRSVVFTLLAGPADPGWLGRGWRYRGKRVVMRGYIEYQRRGQKWPYVAKAQITKGAHQALVKRASVLGSSPTGLVRGAVIELLEGRTERLLIVTSPAAMFEDVKRYWTGEGS
jgi:hypothetical protein